MITNRAMLAASLVSAFAVGGGAVQVVDRPYLDDVTYSPRSSWRTKTRRGPKQVAKQRARNKIAKASRKRNRT